MPLTLSNNSKGGTVGLDIDGRYVSAIQTTSDGISRAASVEMPAGVITDGEVSDGAALSSILKDLFKRSSLPRRVRLGVSNQQIVVRHMELPKIENEKELAAAVRFQASETIAMPLSDVVLDYRVVEETISPEGGTRLRIIVVAARESMITSLVDAVRGAGLRPEAIDLNAFALVRTLALPSDSTESSRVYCHFGGITNLAIALGEICLFTRPLSTAWNEEDDQLTAALAEEIRLSVDFYMAQADARWVGEIVLAGPGSRRDGLAEDLGRLLDVPVSIAAPLGRLQAVQMPAGEDPYRHTVAVGLALGAAA